MIRESNSTNALMTGRVLTSGVAMVVTALVIVSVDDFVVVVVKTGAVAIIRPPQM